MLERIPSRRSPRRAVNRWVVLLSIPIALLVTLCSIEIARGATSQSRSRTDLIVGRSRARAPTPNCALGQLHFTFFGEDGAAGTAVTEFVATDVSPRACLLTGYPRVQFFSGSVLNWRAMPVRIDHAGTGVAFSPHPQPVLLKPNSSRTSSEPGAAFVVTTADFGADGSATCPQVTSLKVGVTGTREASRVPLWYPANLCRTRATTSVSAFFPERLDTYVMPAIAPICTFSETSITTSFGGVGMSHVGLILRFRNFGFVPCRMAGYPSVVLIGTSGSRITPATTTPSGYLGGLAPGTTTSPEVTLEPGQSASSLLEGVDFDDTNQNACPTVQSLLVTPPNGAQQRHVATRFNGCTEVEIHPIISGTTGGLGH